MVDRRVFGRIIDELIIGCVMSPVLGLALLVSLSQFSPEDDELQVVSQMIVVAAVVAAVLYEVLTTRAGGGFGKRAFGLRVVDARTGGQLSWRQSIVRALLVSLQLEFWFGVAIGGSKSLPGRVLFWGSAALFVAWRFALTSSVSAGGGVQGVHDRLVSSRVDARGEWTDRASGRGGQAPSTTVSGAGRSA